MNVQEYFNRYGRIRIEDDRGMLFVSNGKNRLGGKFTVRQFRKNQYSVA